MKLPIVSMEFWLGVIYTIITFMILTIIILFIITCTKSFKKAQKLYENEAKNQMDISKTKIMQEHKDDGN